MDEDLGLQLVPTEVSQPTQVEAPSEVVKEAEQSDHAPQRIEKESEEQVSQPSEQDVHTDEKLVPQSKVNKLMGTANARYKEVEQKLSSLQKQHQLLTERLGGIQDQNSVDAISVRSAAVGLENQYHVESQEMYKSALDNFNASERDFQKQHPDYNSSISEVRGDIEGLCQSNPNLPIYLGMIDNGPAVVYELAKSPEKMATFANLATAKSNASLQKYIAQISNGIAERQSAKKSVAVSPPKPIATISPSAKAAGEGKSVVVNGLVNVDHSQFIF